MTLIKSENKASGPEKPSILEKIQELKHMCFAAGRTPIILLINKANFADLNNTLGNIISFPPERDRPKRIGELLNLDIIINDRVTDFALVDDRHWYEQKF